ncbi:hypothetical protein RvVAR0630_30420 [Agrobacterium vitis]|uniref:hypothetical protein n=1 Tax=Agrobacterium vitis TaxID=373 RepID=UPI0015D8CEED|nr:hypothetical protein [Agrobacterium vitis]BCH60418.1 hypothetical protein RvVAR0630_30420 [Agrobacterium vitis]
MELYYPTQGKSQQLPVVFVDEGSTKDICKNECFATFSACANPAETPTAQGVPASHGDEALVYANNHTNPPKPAYLTLVTIELRRYEAHQEEHKPRGRHAKTSIKAGRATHQKSKAWKRLPADDRERRVRDYAFRSESVTFTLNLTPEKQAKLQKEERPAKALADAINRRCKALLGHAVPISLALEVSPTGRLHAHGIATLERGERKSFREALKCAGGKLQVPATGRETDTRRLWSATGWAAYMRKSFHETAEALGTDKIVYQCNATRAGARDEYEASLARQKIARRNRR